MDPLKLQLQGTSWPTMCQGAARVQAVEGGVASPNCLPNARFPHSAHHLLLVHHLLCSFWTLAEPYTLEIEVKKSRFITSAWPVTTPAEVSSPSIHQPSTVRCRLGHLGSSSRFNGQLVRTLTGQQRTPDTPSPTDAGQLETAHRPALLSISSSALSHQQVNSVGSMSPASLVKFCCQALLLLRSSGASLGTHVVCCCPARPWLTLLLPQTPPPATTAGPSRWPAALAATMTANRVGQV